MSHRPSPHCSLLALTCLPLALASPSPAHAQWITTGVPICTALDPQQYETIIPTADGAIIAWMDGRYQTEQHIFAQHVDSTGVDTWTVGGVAVCVQPGNQNTPVVAPDAYSGAFVFWGDDRNAGSMSIYGQVIDSNGNPLLTANGIPVCTASGSRGDYVTIGDGNPGTLVGHPTGAIVAWDDLRSLSGQPDIYAEHVLRDGTIGWASDGVALCTAAGAQYVPQLVTDGSGTLTGTKGAIVVWTDERNGSSNPDIYAARVTATGTVPWAVNGVAVCAAAGGQYDPHLAYVGGGDVIVAWEDARTPNPGVYAQKLDGNGNALWTANGVPVCTASGNVGNVRVASDGLGGAYIAWSDQRVSDFDVWAQHVDANGNVTWPASGVPVCIDSGSQLVHDVIPDNAGGMIVCWDDYRLAAVPHAYAQRLDTGGNALWADQGVAASTYPAGETNSHVTNGPGQSAIVTWVDARQGSDTDIYANRIYTAGFASVPRTAPRFAFTLASANPARGPVRLRLELPRATPVSAEVLDVQGRRVRQLALEAPRAGGVGELAWDGRTEEGSRVAAGLYFVRVRAGDETASLRLVEVR